MYDIFMGINTGLILTFLTSICQYYINKKRIVNNVFSCYFEFFKCIELSEKKKKIMHYEVYNIYKQLNVFSNKLSKNLAEFSGFIPNCRNPLYKKMNRVFEFDAKVFNLKNIFKLIYPDNRERFEKIVLPFKEHIKNILCDMDSKRFKKEYESFIRINKTLGVIE